MKKWELESRNSNIGDSAYSYLTLFYLLGITPE